jgi:hypothetical protein
MDSIPYDFDNFRSFFTSPYSIPSLVISIVAIVLIEALAHFTLRFPSLRFPTFEPSPTFSKTSNACITAVIVEVLVQIFRMILGALSGCFKWCFRYDLYDMK